MADLLYFSRDTKVILQKGSDRWELPVLDGFSFSQATNTSEITLQEMAAPGASGTVRRGKAMFNDSLAPAEWNFSTYIRPFKSAGNGAGAASAVTDHHAVEELLWAAFVGDANYTNSNASGAVTNVTVSGGSTDLPSTTATGSEATVAQKIRSDNGAITVQCQTQSNGGGSGALIEFTLTRSGTGTNTVIATTIASATSSIIEGGRGYDATDVLQISKEVFAAAVAADGQVTATVTELLTIFDEDIVVDLGSVGAGDAAQDFTGFTRNAGDTTIDFDSSNKATLAEFDIFFIMGARQSTDNTVYKIEGCCVNEATINFDIEGIAQIDWSGFGKLITEQGTTTPAATVTEGTTATSNFIRNRLTSLTLNGSGTSPYAASYDVVLTGGNITFSNNMTFLTPDTLGVVNQPIGHVTGTRSITGNFTCYLDNEDATKSGELFEDLIEDTDATTNSFGLTFKIGGEVSTAPQLHVTMPTCHLEIPTHSIEDIISLETNFHALPSTLEGTNEATLKYIGQTL
jgi:hypothetical protein